ncbi:MAG: nucleotidyl transferase AbiEii/AbiGii toxin family protein [Polyangiaceae bacterium]|jgi:predicted nucleotidyltransferase component of viral defense system
MESSQVRGDLSRLQRAVLAEFFRRERGFFLTGGGALVGYYLHHRTTDDLDLFTTDEQAFSRNRYVVPAVAEALGGSLDVRQDAPDFRRYALTCAGDALMIDVVRERVQQVCTEKPEIDGVVVDPPEEILANKLTALVGRQEERDLVDVYFLEQHGYRVENALDAALAKDGGCTPATLAWLLSEIRIDDETRLPGGLAPAALRAHVDALVQRLRRKAAPAQR